MNKEVYKKHNSFFSFKGKETDIIKQTYKRILNAKKNKLGLESLSQDHQKLLDKALRDLSNEDKKIEEPIFKLTENVLAEVASLPDKYLLKYIY